MAFFPAGCAEAGHRVHPDESSYVPSEVEFYEEMLPGWKKSSVALVTNPSGIGLRMEKVKREFAKNGVQIRKLIGLEHGFLGLSETFSDAPVTIDPYFQVPIYHLYKLQKSEIPQILKDVDKIVFDVQDMGMRCYTYLSVLKRLMDASAGNRKIEFVVLDHPNLSLYLGPLGEEMEPDLVNFAGEFPSLFFTGMTIGEAAQFYNGEYLDKRVNLKVIPYHGISRNFVWEEEGIPWTTPSPNLPTLLSARNYLGLVLLEGVNVSVGRGTAAPFVYFGAPWMSEPGILSDTLNKNSGGKYFYEPVFFKPTFGPYTNEICRGLRMTLTDFEYDPIENVYNLILGMKKNYPTHFQWRASGSDYFVDRLWGTSSFRKALDSRMPYEQFKESLQKSRDSSRRRMEKYLMY